MGLKGKVLEVRRTGEGADVKIDAGGGDAVLVEHVDAAGDDSLPLPGDVAATADAPGAGGEQAIGYHDAKNVGVTKPGERRLYARKGEDGSIVCEIYLKGDGTIVQKNGGSTFEHKPDGSLNHSGDLNVTKDLKVDGNVTVGGEIKADLEVSAMNGGAPVKLSTHIHNTPFGPTSPPTPGT